MGDEFFSKPFCDRCGRPLHARTLSWFNHDVLCEKCIAKEYELKRKLRAAGVDVDSLEGVGYIPEEPK